jgi:hypothetical protein
MRSELKMPMRRFLYVFFEFLVCPPIVINLSKHLIDARATVPNTLQLIGADSAVRARIDANLDYHGIKLPSAYSTEHG